jgi:hypothetical protein
MKKLLKKVKEVFHNKIINLNQIVKKNIKIKVTKIYLDQKKKDIKNYHI